ncbi:hypothetical protein MSG28_006099 [Choristoneura fumiferana]|uniref:Uncharacterized protein n=2 Tax=Choristoneura fumiferana TaxID=7141 RepID=A0ACC0JDI9_CHOFU|nr:hypothetical protein MSG28_006099 [Choristoneura fumiferana]KAI8422199.1 hypothetical protein MSG28_006099 [Choristoneura fumiferana]
MVITALTMEDILPFVTSKANKKKVDTDAILPFIILPLLLLLCTLSRTVTIIVMVTIAMGVLYVCTRPHQKNRSSFFYSWTLSSGIYLFLVFEFGVLRLLEITQVENFVLLVLVACTCYFFHKMKAVADFELATGSSKGKEYRPNYPYFLAGQIFAFATLLFGTNLGLTTVCQPFIFIGTILMPEDCSDVYYQMDLAICFVSSVYGVGYVLIIALVLLKQIFVYIPKYCEPQWRRIVNVLNV